MSRQRLPRSVGIVSAAGVALSAVLDELNDAPDDGHDGEGQDADFQIRQKQTRGHAHRLFPLSLLELEKVVPRGEIPSFKYSNSLPKS